MDELEKIINNFYINDCDEDTRFMRDRSHRLEYITTLKYIKDYIKKNDRILEVGAGTGAYSIMLAQEGYTVDAVELVQKNLDVLKSKITDDMNINAIEGNAINLSMYEDNTFDITLLLGPMYHLFDEESKAKALSEALRVTKENGLIFIAYITNDSVVMSYCLDHMDKFVFDKNNCLINDIKEVFNLYKIEDFMNMMKQYNIDCLNSLTTDGISKLISTKLEVLSENDYQKFVDYHLATCERYDLQGYASHMLYVGKKRR